MLEAKSIFIDVQNGTRLDQPPPDQIWLVGHNPSDTYLTGPAFFDPQVNGYAGVDFQDPNLTREALEHATQAIHHAGCSHFLMTMITAPKDQMKDQFDRWRDLLNQSTFCKKWIPGFHLEGPFLSEEEGFYGAHPRQHLLEADIDLFNSWQSSSGNQIRLVTLAPEIPGGMELISHLKQKNVFVSLGHCNPSMDTLNQAILAGAQMFTHLGNGCPVNLPRHDNIINRVLCQDSLIVSVIPDCIHIPPVGLKPLIRALGSNRLVATTDAISAAGSGPGNYRIGHLNVQVQEDGVVRIPGGKNLAGSSLSMSRGFYNLTRWGGLSVSSAWNCCVRMRNLLFPDQAAPLIGIPYPGYSLPCIV